MNSQHTTDPLPDVLRDVTSGNALLIDVREQDEWQNGHLQDAVLVPLSDLAANPTAAAAELPKDKPIYCHCKSGGRVIMAADILGRLGYDIRPLKPGFTQLVNEGFPESK